MRHLLSTLGADDNYEVVSSDSTMLRCRGCDTFVAAEKADDHKQECAGGGGR